jgi:hypothetical protein
MLLGHDHLPPQPAGKSRLTPVLAPQPAQKLEIDTHASVPSPAAW